MKRYLNKIMLTAASGLLLFSACKKDEAKVYYEGGTSPVLTSTSAPDDTTRTSMLYATL